MSVVVDIRKKLATFDLEVSFEVGNETLGFLGASGCGKSMTLRCIAGVETPDEGKIIVNGTTYFDSAARANMSPQQRKTALLFQNYQLFPHMSVTKNIAAGLGKDVSAEERDRIVRAELRRFSLVGFEDRYPLQLSGGQQQRVALARMLAARPAILMLDEPFSALDSHLKAQLEQNMQALFDSFDGSIMYVSHDIDEAYRLCDRIAVVDNGKIESIGTPGETVGRPSSLAAMKLSGCKNMTRCEYCGPHTVWCPEWGVELAVDEEVPENAIYLGVRASYIHLATGHCPRNVYCARALHVSDSRFEHWVTLDFETEKQPEHQRAQGAYLEKSYVQLKQDKLAVRQDEFIQAGDVVDLCIPPSAIYTVTH